MRALSSVVCCIITQHTNQHNAHSVEFIHQGEANNRNIWQAWSQLNRYQYINGRHRTTIARYLTVLCMKLARVENPLFKNVYDRMVRKIFRRAVIHKESARDIQKALNLHICMQSVQHMMSKTTYLSYVKRKKTLKMTEHNKVKRWQWTCEHLGCNKT